MKYYTVKVKLESELSKKVIKESYLVQATSVIEAETIIAKDFANSALEYTVSDVIETNYKGVFLHNK